MQLKDIKRSITELPYNEAVSLICDKRNERKRQLTEFVKKVKKVTEKKSGLDSIIKGLDKLDAEQLKALEGML